MKNPGWRCLRRVLLLLALLALAGCAATRPPETSPAHMSTPPAPEADIPSVVAPAPVLPPPAPRARQETYTVVVIEVPVKELLFSLARDAKLNVDIHSGITGTVSLNAVDQTLPQILDRIARQVSLRYELSGPNLLIAPDAPYWRTYPVNYVNMSRDSVGEVSVATQIATTGGTVSGGSTQESGNVSKTKVTSTSSNHFWGVIETNIRSIITPGAAQASAEPASDSTQGSSVVANPVSGVISVNATQRQHEQVQLYLEQVIANALRQVLIEMTIVEVELGDRYQAGVDWARLTSGDGLSLVSAMTGSNLSTAPAFSMAYSNTSNSGNVVSSTLKMLESFGDVKVLSSPKIMALNNQTALLKVVDEKVYFSVELEIEAATDTTPERRTFISEIHTVPVGMVMSVTPQINADRNVTLNIRPTISRITGYATDPAPRLANSGFDNLIPEIQVREMESLLQVASGQMVVLGGLMQNKVDKNKGGVPFLSSLPLVGNLFSYRDDSFTKTELVIFLRPNVISGGGVDFDLGKYREYLPQAGNDGKGGASPLRSSGL